ncbi:hypothetical protein F5878DRAFT_645934 [Lentinula raphanica]|uniref:Uncharacterized protein n=1 Tax=Lentinula raphanica TaxID=153919 RepID=A0AA38NZN4_9AGAR|nr:hypothetical protein F5878DRAFT_645934 [Lentinula raphanica]
MSDIEGSSAAGESDPAHTSSTVMIVSSSIFTNKDPQDTNEGNEHDDDLSNIRFLQLSNIRFLQLSNIRFYILVSNQSVDPIEYRGVSYSLSILFIAGQADGSGSGESDNEDHQRRSSPRWTTILKSALDRAKAEKYDLLAKSQTQVEVSNEVLEELDVIGEEKIELTEKEVTKKHLPLAGVPQWIPIFRWSRVLCFLPSICVTRSTTVTHPDWL